MGWRGEAGHEAGDEPGPGFWPPRHGVHHDAEPDDVAPGADGSPREERLAVFAAGGARSGGRLAGFAKGGEWDTCPPSAELAAVLESVSGGEWRCSGATDDEIVGIVRRWAAIESWAGAARLGAVRELIRREDKPWMPTDQHAGQPDPWSESLTHELALALAASAGSADRTEWLAWELGTRLPGIDALLTEGVLTYGKAKAVAEAFKHLSDADAAHAEALILGQLVGKTYLQVLRLAAAAASKVDPEGDERRRKDAEQSARVRLWREQSGAAALAGFDLPTDQALAAHANVCARAEQYKASEAFPGEQMDQLRAMGYLDLLNGITAETRIADARAKARADAPAGPTQPAPAPDAPGGAPDDDCDGGSPGNGPSPDASGDPSGDGGQATATPATEVPAAEVPAAESQTAASPPARARIPPPSQGRTWSYRSLPCSAWGTGPARATSSARSILPCAATWRRSPPAAPRPGSASRSPTTTASRSATAAPGRDNQQAKPGNSIARSSPPSRPA